MQLLHIWTALALVLVAQATHPQHRSGQRCDCNRKSHYCVADAEGMRCLDCRGNTAGRRCERCEDGFHRWTSGLPCRPCQCSPSGSVTSKCDSRGRCSCKDGVTGDKCDRCANGAPLGPNGCTEAVLRDEPVGRSTSCFCYGHASSCAVAQGYAVHPIDSKFTDGPEGWQVSMGRGVMTSQVQFRWVQSHEDLEVISQNSLPVYLNAPARYLGNQVLSYGQNLSFSLRLDRGVRHPSTSDVVLEGSGLRVGAALGELRSIIPCGQKIPFSFRLDERPGSRWRPQLSPLQFQALLHNLTAVKIRTTFGEDGRGYLDNVSLMSAQRGSGRPAPWVQSCVCEAGYQGPHCDRCAPGFKRRSPADRAYSACVPCDCKAGSCDPDTGDCVSADETPRRQKCLSGYYSDPSKPLSCVRCPCPGGASCALLPGSLQVQCDLCPPGVTGSHCQLCQEGFYGDPLGERGPQRPCVPCVCVGRGDAEAGVNCDPFSGECLKCVNNSRDGQREACLEGFYRNRLTDTCDACACDLIGSASSLCGKEGQCTCRDGYQGRRCHRSTCPSCFQPITAQVKDYAAKLRELERLFSDLGGGSGTTSSTQVDRTLQAANQLVTELQETADRLKASERGLQQRLTVISDQQLAESQDVQSLAQAAERLGREQASYRTTSGDVQTLIDQMKRTLGEAKAKIQAADLPQGDEAQAVSNNLFSTLITKATELAERHLGKAEQVEQSAGDALKDSEKSLGLMRSLMSRENTVKELLGDLNTMYDQASGQVKAMESQASGLSGQAGAESKRAGDMLKQIGGMERGIAAPLQGDELASRLASLEDQVSENLSAYRALQEDVGKDKVLVEGLLDRGNVAQQVYDGLLVRVDAAKADTEDALSGITGNMKGMEDTLASLRGFDERIAGSKALADAAIGRLPSINGTIQQAARSNGQTLGLLGAVADDYSDALATVGELQAEAAGLEGRVRSLGPSAGLLTGATQLRKDLGAMEKRAGALQGTLAGELTDARTLQMDAQQAVSDAEDAQDKAMDTRDAVATTLQKVNDLLNAIGQTGGVDEQRVAQLEASLADARNHVDQNLKPRLQDMEALEAAQRRLLGSLNTDIDNVLDDITNLEDILRSVPNVCINTVPQELA
ncbi:unnamed protein product [Merluccius merluccius]